MIMQDLGGYIATGLGTLAVILLGILLRQTLRVGEKLDQHIVKMAELLPLKVSSADCAAIRGQCVDFLGKIIAEPIDRRIADIAAKRKDRWTQQADDNKALWCALKGHTHTKIEANQDDEVLIRQKKP